MILIPFYKLISQPLKGLTWY